MQAPAMIRAPFNVAGLERKDDPVFPRPAAAGDFPCPVRRGRALSEKRSHGSIPRGLRRSGRSAAAIPRMLPHAYEARPGW